VVPRRINIDIELPATFDERLFIIADTSFVPQLPGEPALRTTALEADMPSIVREHCASAMPFFT